MKPKFFAITFQPSPLSEPNLDWLFRQQSEAEMPIHVALIEAPTEAAAVGRFVQDDAKRCSKTGLIAIVTDWEEIG